jgi:hypothetical protein
MHYKLDITELHNPAGTGTFNMTTYPMIPDSLGRYILFKFHIFMRVGFILLGTLGLTDYLSTFMKKLMFLLLTLRLEKILKFKYLLQLCGLSMLLYFYAREMRLGPNPSVDGKVLKLCLILTQPCVSYIGMVLLPL